MKRKIGIISLLLTFGTALFAQNNDIDISGFVDKEFSINLTTRLLGSNNEMLWHVDSSDVTFSGEAVKVKLRSDNLVIIANITPFISPDNSIVLVARGEVFLSNDSEQNDVKYYTTLKSLPVNLGEKVIFFPLGTAYDSESNRYSIEMEIQVESLKKENKEKN